MQEVQHQHEFTTPSLTLTRNVTVQMAIVLALAAVVLWAVFLSNYPPIHDAFHELRHSMYVIPCH
jgi:cobalt transporter subunit CbtB